jgi:predicted nucleic acid-binding protein
MILVDTNVLLDLTQYDSRWAEWSKGQLETAILEDRLAINPVIYAELSVTFETIEKLEAALTAASLKVLDIPREALFLAGKAFLNYKRRKGSKTGVLADFFVGAHAAVLGCPLLTRDAARYRTYFPGVQLISP